MSPAFPARRRADEFDRLVESASTGADAITDASPELRELATLATALRTTPEVQPRAAFSAGLRERLMQAAATELAAVPETGTTDTIAIPAPRRHAERRTPSQGRRHRRRLTAGIAALAIIGGTGGTALASQNALPGDSLYPVKRVLERLHTGVSVSQRAKGHDLLSDAGTRLDEVHDLAQQAPQGKVDTQQIATTLATFSSQAQQASTLLVKDYHSSQDTSSLQALQTFAASGISQLSQLAAVLPATTKSALSQAAQTLVTISQTVHALDSSLPGGVLQVPSSLIGGLADTLQGISDGITTPSGTTATKKGGTSAASKPSSSVSLTSKPAASTPPATRKSTAGKPAESSKSSTPSKAPATKAPPVTKGIQETLATTTQLVQVCTDALEGKYPSVPSSQWSSNPSLAGAISSCVGQLTNETLPQATAAVGDIVAGLGGTISSVLCGVLGLLGLCPKS